MKDTETDNGIWIKLILFRSLSTNLFAPYHRSNTHSHTYTNQYIRTYLSPIVFCLRETFHSRSWSADKGVTWPEDILSATIKRQSPSSNVLIWSYCKWRERWSESGRYIEVRRMLLVKKWSWESEAPCYLTEIQCNRSGFLKLTYLAYLLNISLKINYRFDCFGFVKKYENWL